MATIEIFEGSDSWGWDNGYPLSYTGANAINARGKFLSQLASSETEDFESYTSYRPYYFGYDIEKLKFASYRLRDTDSYRLKDFGEDIDLVEVYANDLKYPMAGRRYLEVDDLNFILYFDEPISAFGFYFSSTYGWFYGSLKSIGVDIEYVDGTKKHISGYCGKYKLCYFSFIERDSNKLITSIDIYTGRHAGILFDDMTVASDYQVKNMYHGVERELDENDPFLNSSTPWIDTDNDGVADNADKDDDNDGIPDTVERANRLNPLNAADAQGDLDGDGFSNVIEYQMGTNMKNASSKPVWAPVMMGDIMIFIPAKP